MARTDELWVFGGSTGGAVFSTGTTFRPPAGSIQNVDIQAAAGIAYTKVQQFHRGWRAQAGTAVTETVPLGVVYGATGTLVSIKAGTIVACVGAATITVDLKKNGTTCLTAVITLDNANTARVVEAGTLSVTSLVAGDFLELVITATAGGGTIGTGLAVEVRWAEDPA